MIRINRATFWVIIPAAGTGQRFTQSVPPQNQQAFNTIPDKLLLPLPTGRLVLQETIFRIGQVPSVTGVVVLTSAGNESFIAALMTHQQRPLLPPDKRLLLTTGGATRRATVQAGLHTIAQTDAKAGIIAIHDAARPLIEPDWLEAAYHQLQQTTGDGIVGLCAGTKIYDTVKACHPTPTTFIQHQQRQKQPLDCLPCIQHTVDRTPLWQVQTPQLFSFNALQMAHQTVPLSAPVTDDAQLVEYANRGGVLIKPASPWNIKLTTWLDYQLLQRLL
jgi:2-C-methyl-D-erythritol 4-phosphate cytidylyltransferase